MEPILTSLSPATLAKAIPANLYTLIRSFSRTAVCETWDNDGTYRWRTPVAHPWFNGVLASRLPDGSSPQAIREAIDYFKGQGVITFTWWLSPETDPLPWEGLLFQQGFRYSGAPPGMAVKLAELRHLEQPTPGLELRTVQDLEELQTWAVTFGAGYGLGDEITAAMHQLLANLGVELPLRHYLGWLDGQPVATSTLFLGAGVAGIYNVGTRIEARGRGIGAQMTIQPLLEARRMGYQAGILQSSEMGFNVYRRLGFQHLVDVGHYYWTA